MSKEKSSQQSEGKAGIIRRFFRWWCTPSRMALGSLLTLGFVAGIVFVLGFHTSLELAGSDEFCTSCHEMRDNVYQEYTQTAHFTNRTGVQAGCSDCHVPREFFPMIWRKIQASKEVWGHLTGIINTPAKFEEHRLAMAQVEWARMRANDSQACRNCHQFDYMDLSRQRTVAAQFHTTAVEEGKTCIDCHKGIAHRLPDMRGIEDAF